VGSTELSTQLDPEEWRDRVAEYHRAAAEVITRFGGEVVKYLGDGVLAVFGYPQALEDAAERAVRAGLTTLEGIRKLRGTEFAEESAPTPLSVRIGIHTGLTVIADAGGKPDVFGETPNVAARVQGAAEPDSVVITAATHRMVSGLFVVEERGAQRLKGVPEPVVLYRVVQPSGVRSRLEASAGRQTPFVGRQAELGVLRAAWERVVEGMGHTVLVQGEAGLGKSRLCATLREQLSAEPHTWLECRCSPYTSGTAFRPVIELVEQALTFQPTDSPAEKLVKLSLGLERGGFAAQEAVPLLAEWLELPERSGYVPLSISPDAKRRRVLEILAAWNLKLGQLRPMVLLVEDLHWCDPSSLELLGRLVAQSATARMLLVGTARPEFASPWPARSNLQTLTLGRLTKRQTREMIAAVSAARSLPEAVFEQLVARTDGIPLFAEELTQAVVEAGPDAAMAEIPVTLQQSLLARLDRLSSAKEVAQRAAVLGREFSYQVLSAMAGLDEGSLQQGLTQLVEAELVFVRGVSPDATYTFKHALVQEAAYLSLLKRRRQQLHSRVVDVLAAQLAERAPAEPEVLARHAEMAGRIDDAITYHQRAGEQAQARSAYEEAIGHLRHAIALLAARPEGRERDTREAILHLVLGGCLTAARGFAHPEVEAAYVRAQTLCDTTGDVRPLGLALNGLSTFYYNCGQIERGRVLAARLLTVAEQSGDNELAILGHDCVSNAEFYQGKFASSLQHCEAVGPLCERRQRDAVVHAISVDPRISAMGYGAWALWELGWTDRALARAREGVVRARCLADPFSLAFALFFETVVHWLRRDSTAQRERGTETIALSEVQGFPLFLGLGRAFHAASRVATGEPEAITDLLAGLALGAATGNQGGAPSLFALLGEAYMASGQLDEACGAIDTGLTIAVQTGQPFFDAELLRLQGEIQVRRGDSHQIAAECFERALDIARGQEAKSFELRAATSLARLWWVEGRGAAARNLLAPIHAWFAEGVDTGDLRGAKTLLEELG
jgi:class 3 adenylate cyclase/tetratricopeptide (TPR) repeat protein